jgi:hypothetical protein
MSSDAIVLKVDIDTDNATKALERIAAALNDKSIFAR